MACCALDTGHGLRVVRIGEPAKVRSSLKPFTLKAQVAAALAQDPKTVAAMTRQQQLRREVNYWRSLQNARRREGRSSGAYRDPEG